MAVVCFVSFSNICFFTVVCNIKYLPVSKFRKGLRFRFLQTWMNYFLTCYIVYKLQRNSPPYIICYKTIRPSICIHFPARRNGISWLLVAWLLEVFSSFLGCILHKGWIYIYKYIYIYHDISPLVWYIALYFIMTCISISLIITCAVYHGMPVSTIICHLIWLNKINTRMTLNAAKPWAALDW